MVSGRAAAYVAIVYMSIAIGAMRVNVKLQEPSPEDSLTSKVDGKEVTQPAPLAAQGEEPAEKGAELVKIKEPVANRRAALDLSGQAASVPAVAEGVPIAIMETTEEKGKRALSGHAALRVDRDLATQGPLAITPEALEAVQDLSLHEFLKRYVPESASDSHDSPSYSNRASINSTSTMHAEDDLSGLLDELFSEKNGSHTSGQEDETSKTNHSQSLIPTLPPSSSLLPPSFPPLASSPRRTDHLAAMQWLSYSRQKFFAEKGALTVARASLPARPTPAQLPGFPSWSVSNSSSSSSSSSRSSSSSSSRAQQAGTTWQQQRQQLKAEVSALAARHSSLPVGSTPAQQPGFTSGTVNSSSKRAQTQAAPKLPPAWPPWNVPTKLLHDPMSPNNKKRTYKDMQHTDLDFKDAMQKYKALGCAELLSLRVATAVELQECCFASHIWTICTWDKKNLLKKLESFNQLYEDVASALVSRERVAKALHDNYGNDSVKRAREELEAEELKREEGRMKLRKDDEQSEV